MTTCGDFSCRERGLLAKYAVWFAVRDTGLSAFFARGPPETRRMKKNFRGTLLLVRGNPFGKLETQRSRLFALLLRFSLYLLPVVCSRA